MKIGLKEASEVTYFTNIVKLLGVINDELTLSVTPEGISVITMDPSHVAMIDLALKSSAFGEYVVEDPIQLSFSVVELKKRLDAIAAKDELVTIEHDGPNNKLILDINEPSTRRKRKMKINLLEPMDEEVPKPKITFQGKTRILLGDLDRGIKDAEMVSAHVVIRTGHGDKLLALQAQGDMGESLMEIHDPLDFKNTSDGELTGTYTLQFLSEFVGAIKALAEVITLETNTDMPLRITVEGAPSLECSYYLAPCIGV